ncbi:MAG: FeoB-associated Cys-rich membrane protein [Bacteroidales bacterium]|nr:FeoB-associated Cys-rich membrane protein [Bacteroidales bacterium]
MVQTIIVVLVVTAALFFAVRGLIRTFRGRGGCGCGCSKCPYSDCCKSHKMNA